MNKLKQYWPSILPILVAAWSLYGSQIQGAIASHPAVSSVVAALYAVFAHLMPAPTKS